MATEPTWPELLGSSDDWTTLLSPLDPSLRNLILRCGDFCQATYDAFNNDQNSPFCGTSRYGKSSFFHNLLFDSPDDYSVASFLYATASIEDLPGAFLLRSRSRESWDRESNWIGYIAVSSDQLSASLGRREIYVVWRGTTRDYEWMNVFGANPQSAQSLLRPSKIKPPKLESGSSSSSDDEDDDNSPKVMDGWLKIYVSTDPKSPFTNLSARTQLQRKIRELRERYQGEGLSIILTGHSLGASLAIVGAFDLAENGVDDIPIAAFVFGSPQVGNKAFQERLESHENVKILHMKNKIDVIPHYPGRLLGYVYTGTELEIDTRKSPWLRDSKNPSDWHNLQAMLHVVAGWNGEEAEFELRVKRSLALVNKSSAFLKDECLVPGSWWVEKNRGLVRNDEGEWAMAPPADEDQPVPEF